MTEGRGGGGGEGQSLLVGAGPRAGWGLEETERSPLAGAGLPRSSGALGHTCTTAASIEHTVQRGDTLRALAVRYHTTVGSILQLNRARSEDVLLLRRTIRIPVSSAAQSSPSSSTTTANTTTTRTTTVTTTTAPLFGLSSLFPCFSLFQSSLFQSSSSLSQTPKNR